MPGIRAARDRAGRKTVLMKHTLRILNRRASRGLTLIELIVVLVVLTAVAGIVLPRLPDMIFRTHNATSATSMHELIKGFDTQVIETGDEPDQFDNLIDGGVSGGSLINFLMGMPANPVAGDLDVLTLTQEDVDALNAAGITSVMPLKNDDGSAGWTPTYNPYLSGTPEVLAAGDTVSAADPAVVNQLFPAFPDTGGYVCLGIGSACTVVGEGISTDAPVHFAQSESMNAANRYNRFVVMYQIRDGSGSIPIARRVGFAAPMGIGLTTGGGHIELSYDE